MSSGDLTLTRRTHNGHTYGDPELNRLLDEVNRRARDFVVKTNALEKKSKFRRSMFSRSTNNLSELKEAEEDEMARKARLERLKFPSEFDLHRKLSYEVQETAETVAKALNALVRAGKRSSCEVKPRRSARSSREVGIGRGSGRLHRSEISMSEPNLLDASEG